MAHSAEFSKLRLYRDQAPVDVEALAREYGLSIHYEETLPNDVSGKLSKEDGQYRIIVNAKHRKNRQRFTIAHELGHYLLHRDNMNHVIEDDALYRSQLSNKLEAQANGMAATILMPYPLLRRLINRDGVKKLDDLARTLGVSKHALKIRLSLPVAGD